MYDLTSKLMRNNANKTGKVAVKVLLSLIIVAAQFSALFFGAIGLTFSEERCEERYNEVVEDSVRLPDSPLIGKGTVEEFLAFDMRTGYCDVLSKLMMNKAMSKINGTDYETINEHSIDMFVEYNSDDIRREFGTSIMFREAVNDALNKVTIIEVSLPVKYSLEVAGVSAIVFIVMAMIAAGAVSGWNKISIAIRMVVRYIASYAILAFLGGAFADSIFSNVEGYFDFSAINDSLMTNLVISLAVCFVCELLVVIINCSIHAVYYQHLEKIGATASTSQYFGNIDLSEKLNDSQRQTSSRTSASKSSRNSNKSTAASNVKPDDDNDGFFGVIR